MMQLPQKHAFDRYTFCSLGLCHLLAYYHRHRPDVSNYYLYFVSPSHTTCSSKKQSISCTLAMAAAPFRQEVGLALTGLLLDRAPVGAIGVIHRPEPERGSLFQSICCLWMLTKPQQHP